MKSRKRQSQQNGGNKKSKKSSSTPDAATAAAVDNKTAMKNFINSMDDVEHAVNNLKHSDPVLQLFLKAPSQNNDHPHDNNHDKDDEDVDDISNARADTINIPDISFTTSSSSSTTLLEKLLYPLPSNIFLNTCFRRKAVHIKANNSKRIQSLVSNYMFDLNVKRIFEETSSDSIFLWIPTNTNMNNNGNDNNQKKQKHKAKSTKTTQQQQQTLQSIELQDPEMAHLLHTSSHYASYCRAPPELEQPLVYNMLKDTGIGCGQYEYMNQNNNNHHDDDIEDGSDRLFNTNMHMKSMGRGEVETFIGTKNHLTNWHIDFQENFTIQLSGCKKWTLKQSTLKHPLRGITPHYKNTYDVVENQLLASKLSTNNFGYNYRSSSINSSSNSGHDDEEKGCCNSFGDEVEIVMNAGDVLYFPAGMWHKVETLEYGVSVNISLMGSNYAAVVCDALEHLLLKREEWREIICNKNTCTSKVPSAAATATTANANTASGDNPIMLKLNSLLEELPDIIRQFQKNGGAQCILPPVLQQAPNFVLVNDDHHGDNDCDDNNYNEEDYESSDLKSEQMEEEEEGIDNIEENECEESAKAINNVIDISSFQCPIEYKKPSSKHRLLKNPLATIIRMADIAASDSRIKCVDNHDNYFVLNVCYAGNEQHEPSIRVVLFDETRMLGKLCDIEQKSIENDEECAYQELLADSALLGALVYYGYVIWTKPPF